MNSGIMHSTILIPALRLLLLSFTYSFPLNHHPASATKRQAVHVNIVSHYGQGCVHLVVRPTAIFDPCHRNFPYSPLALHVDFLSEVFLSSAAVTMRLVERNTVLSKSKVIKVKISIIIFFPPPLQFFSIFLLIIQSFMEAYAGGCIASHTLQCHLQKSPQASFHAGCLPILNN